MKKLFIFGIVLLLLSSLGLSATSTLDNDLVFYLSLEEDITDDTKFFEDVFSTLDFNDTIYGDSIRATGKNNYGQNITNAPTDSISSIYDNSFPIRNDGNWSIGFWFNGEGSAMSLFGTYKDVTELTTDHFYCYTNDVAGTIICEYEASTEIFGTMASGVISQSWNHFIWINNGTDNSNSAIWLNGVRTVVDVSAGIDDWLNYGIGGGDNGIWTFGSLYPNYAGSNDGLIDEIGAWNRTLTDSEIATLYGGGVGDFYPFTATPNIFTITATAINGTAIQSFSLYQDETTLLGNTTTGELNLSYGDSIRNLSITSTEDGGYFNKSYLNWNTSTDLSATGLFQAEITFDAFELSSGLAVTNSNFSFGTQTNKILHFNAGTYNITFFNQTTEHYNKTQEFTFSALDNFTGAITGVYDSVLNVSAFLVTNNTYITLFDLNLTSTNPVFNKQYSTTDGDVLVGMEQDYNYSILFNYPDYALQTYNITPANSSDNYQFNVYTSNSFNFTFLDETNNATVTELVNVEFVSNSYSYNYSTTTGYLYVDLLVPAQYTIRYSSANYGRIREFYYTLTNQSHQDITLYLINSGNSTAVTVNVYDKLTVEGVQNAVVQLQRYSALDNSYQTIAMYSTDVSGTAYFDVEADNEYYKILVDFPYLTRKYTSEPFYISATTYNVYISLIDEIADTYFEEQGIISSISYNNVTDTFTASWTDSSLVADQYCLRLKKYGIYSLEILQTECSTNPNYELSVSGLAGNTTNYAVLSATINGETRILNSAWISTVSGELDYGQMGAFMSLIIVGVFALLVSFHSLALILGATGLIFSKLLGLLPLGWGEIIAVTIVAVVLNLIINLFKK